MIHARWSTNVSMYRSPPPPIHFVAVSYSPSPLPAPLSDDRVHRFCQPLGWGCLYLNLFNLIWFELMNCDVICYVMCSMFSALSLSKSFISISQYLRILDYQCHTYWPHTGIAQQWGDSIWQLVSSCTVIAIYDHLICYGREHQQTQQT